MIDLDLFIWPRRVRPPREPETDQYVKLFVNAAFQILPSAALLMTLAAYLDLLFFILIFTHALSPPTTSTSSSPASPLS